MSFTLDEVDAAEARIRSECPQATIARGDYDWALSVANAKKTAAYIVFRPERPDIGQSEVIGDLDKIIAALKS